MINKHVNTFVVQHTITNSKFTTTTAAAAKYYYYDYYYD